MSERSHDLLVGRAVAGDAEAHLLRGPARFVDDLDAPGCLHAAFVRSPLAAASIREVDVGAARSVPGVRAVVTGADLEHLPGIEVPIDRPEYVNTTSPLLATDRVRFQGEPVAVVVATSRYAAEDAAELVAVDYEPGCPVVTLEEALARGAPAVHDQAAGNVLLDVVLGDDAATSAVRRADTVIELEISSARVTAAPLEGRACLAEYSSVERRLTLRTSTQQPHLVRGALADLLGLPESRIRVVTADVGGAFGQKLGISREEVVISHTAVALEAPVKWVEDRLENLTAEVQGHEQRYRAVAGFDAAGTLLGLSVDVDCNTGAYSAHPWSCALEPVMAASELPGPYGFPAYRARARAVASNKPPSAPCRGVSRPQITLLTERVMDRAASALGLSRADIRRRNLIPPGESAHVSPSGLSYDEGSHVQAFDRCLELVDFDTWPERQAEARARGQLLGLGIATLSEHTAYGTATFVQRRMPLIPGFDTAEVSMDASGTVTVSVGTVAQGQGHRTTMAQLVADELSVGLDAVRVEAGDTDTAPFGWGAFASRSGAIGGSACVRAARALRSQLVTIAAHLLGVPADRVLLESGRCVVVGDPSTAVTLASVARTAYRQVHLLPDGVDPILRQRAVFEPEAGAFSNATHAVLLEVDPSTGAVRLRRYVVVEDCGRVINPAVVDGQIRGGIAMGIGFALYEQVRHDADGQCQTGTLMDYLLPTAAECCDVEIHHLATPTGRSETGSKGVGESGTIGAPAAIVGGINDALGHLGVAFDAIPVTPPDIARALATGRVHSHALT